MPLKQIATIKFEDVETGAPGVAIIKEHDGNIGLSLSLEADGDIGVFLGPGDCDRIIRALQEAVQASSA